MNQSNDLSSGQLLGRSGYSINGTLNNMTTLQAETAPLPYITNQNGNWTSSSSWLNGSVQSIPNSNGVTGDPITWNIVRTLHNISSTNKDITVLGLLVDANTLSIENANAADGQKLIVMDRN